MEKSHDQKNLWPPEESVKMHKTPQNSIDDEPTEKDIKKAMKDPKFQKIMDKILNLDKERYLHTLAQHGVKLSSDFDVNQLRNTTNTQGSPQQEHTCTKFFGTKYNTTRSSHNN